MPAQASLVRRIACGLTHRQLRVAAEGCEVARAQQNQLVVCFGRMHCFIAA